MAKARFQPQLPPQHSGASFADLGESASTSHDVGATPNQASPADLDHFQWLKHDFSRSFPHSTPGPRLRIWANQRLLRTMWVPPPTKPPAKARFQPQLPPQHSGASFADLGESASTSHDVGATPNQASPADLDHFQWLKHDFSRSFPHSIPGPRLRIWANQRLLRTMSVPPSTKPPLPIWTIFSG